jgi:hypothetical protein
MKKYENFLNTYKPIETEYSESFSDHINSNLKGGKEKTPLFPNFAPINKLDNKFSPFLRQDGTDFLDITKEFFYT